MATPQAADEEDARSASDVSSSTEAHRRRQSDWTAVRELAARLRSLRAVWNRLVLRLSSLCAACVCEEDEQEEGQEPEAACKAPPPPPSVELQELPPRRAAPAPPGAPVPQARAAVVVDSTRFYSPQLTAASIAPSDAAEAEEQVAQEYRLDQLMEAYQTIIAAVEDGDSVTTTATPTTLSPPLPSSPRSVPLDDGCALEPSAGATARSAPHARAQSLGGLDAESRGNGGHPQRSPSPSRSSDSEEAETVDDGWAAL